MLTRIPIVVIFQMVSYCDIFNPFCMIEIKQGTSLSFCAFPFPISNGWKKNRPRKLNTLKEYTVNQKLSDEKENPAHWRHRTPSFWKTIAHKLSLKLS